MESRKKRWIIDLFTILVMMATVILLCHPIGRNWTEEEIDRYVGTDGDYSPDVDTYYYLRKAKEFSQGGIGSITLVVNREEDPMCTTGDTIAKEANGAMPQLLAATTALVWYVLHAIGVKIGIYTLAIRFCSFLLSLFVIPVYLFLKKRTSRVAAVLGSLLVTLEVPFFRHSHVGFYDTDAMIGLLALVLVLSLYECFTAESRKKQAIFGTFSVVALILLRFTWTAFFIYGIISVGTVMVGAVTVRLCRRFSEEQRKRLLVPAAVLCAIVILSLALGWSAFVSLAKGFVSPSAGGKGDWPSETLNIAELNKVALSDASSFWYHFLGVGLDVTSFTGGALVLALLAVSAIICIVRLIKSIKSIRNGLEENDEVFILSAVLTWLFGTVFLALFGARYMEFVVLPSSIVIGLGFHRVSRYLEKKTTNGQRVIYVIAGLMLFCGMILRFPIAAVIMSAVLMVGGWFLVKVKAKAILPGVVAATVLLPVMISCEVVCAQETPLIERPMEEAMCWVKSNTSPDAVLADFWNLGYIYQFYGERRTIADGGTYNGQFFYWLANMLITDDSRLSSGIARMLQNCGIDGSEYAQKLVGDAEKTRELLRVILPLSRGEAESKLRQDYAFSEEQISRLLDFTHPWKCPDIYFAVSHNTFELISSLMVYQNWKKGAENASEGTFYSAKAVSHPTDGEKTLCKMTTEDGASTAVYIVSDEEELTGYVITPGGLELDFARQLYIRDGEMIYDRISSSPAEGRNLLSEEALMIFEERGEVSAVIAEKEAVDSVFIKLFLLNGSGQDVFEKVYDFDNGKESASVQKRLTDLSTISIWKVKTE